MELDRINTSMECWKKERGNRLRRELNLKKFNQSDEFNSDEFFSPLQLNSVTNTESTQFNDNRQPCYNDIVVKWKAEC